ncbi:MAG TPA: hypothetical protein VLA95_06680, partial [Gemmatimonadales bacterium]|nr:hypothetical protein [Gemmatimonadales bacterium]
IALGTAAMALVLLAVRWLVAAAPPTATPEPFAAPGVVLLLGPAGACAAALAAAWLALRPIANTYRQAALASVAALATLMLGFLTVPVHRFLGPVGLGGVAGLAALGAAVALRAVRRRTPRA